MVTSVLVADDDLQLRTAVARFLEADGMSVQVARSGDEVLSKLADGSIDLLVTDVSMPGLSGLDVATMARTAGTQLPILLMTARREPWVAESVRKLQCADVLYKPFSGPELVRHSHALLERQRARPVDASSAKEEHLFPPALVPILRKRLARSGSLADVSDEDLIELFSVVFLAGLEREEGERNPVRVVFGGSAPIDTEPTVNGVPSPLYRWSTVKLETARAFSTDELVKLASATTGGRTFVEVRHQDGKLFITGLAREGVNLEGDPALKMVVERPGALSIRMGRQHVLDYEYGRVQSHASRVIFAGGPVRTTLELTSAACGLPPAASAPYLNVVRQLVAKLSAHGRGGILVIGAAAQAEPIGIGRPGYRTHPDISLAAMLRRMHEVQSHAEVATPAERGQDQLLLGALHAEMQHTIAEFGALTALDGATVLDPSLALTGFGLVLSVDDAGVILVEAEDTEATAVTAFDFGCRGARHRAAATYAWNHPGSVVFVASQDGDLGCLLRSPGAGRVILWRFHSTDLQTSSAPLGQ